MNSLLALIIQIINIYTYILIIYVIVTWLVGFNIINTSNRLVYSILEILHKLCEPVLQYIRRFIPNFGNIDISPVIALLLIWFLQNLLIEYWPR